MHNLYLNGGGDLYEVALREWINKTAGRGLYCFAMFIEDNEWNFYKPIWIIWYSAHSV